MPTTYATTWPHMVKRARAYLAVAAAGTSPDEWARWFAAGIVAMDEELAKALREPRLLVELVGERR
jgi:hypothetical protein